MLTLYGSGPAFGLPDPSPFVMKTQVQLRMAGIAYAFERARPQDALRGKIPFIVDDGPLRTLAERYANLIAIATG